MDEQAIRKRIAEFSHMMTAVPENRAATAGGSYISHAPPPPGKSLEELLDHVRLQLNYLMFDLEATRRENQYLRQMIERRPNLGEGPETF